jgi:Cu(I)/Ag(I) efflux system membrane protein CusA/SilA
MAQIFWMPIQTRTEMLTTGFRSVLGIKVFGPDLKGIENVAVQIEQALSDFPNTRSAFAERTTGGYFLDFTVNREAAARYGLGVEDVNQILESAIGGNTVAMTVEGRERYPISVRYARDFRSDLDKLRRVLVPTPTGAQVPISLLADVDYRTGPPSIREENAQLVGYVFVDITSSDIDGFVRAASIEISQKVHFPQGYYIQWAGQFEYLKAAEGRLVILVPFTLLIIFFLIYLNTRSATKTFIVLLSVPFSLVGAFWMLFLLHYNMSVAVWVGLIALAGLDAETGVVMLLYLDHAWEKYKAQGRMNSIEDLYAAVIEGAVQRIRPKIMTVCAIIFGLLPIMWSPVYQAGADVMKRIATPDDRRRYHIGNSQPLDLSGHLRDLEEALTSVRTSRRSVSRPAGLRTRNCDLRPQAQDSSRFYCCIASRDRHCRRILFMVLRHRRFHLQIGRSKDGCGYGYSRRCDGFHS